MAFPLDEHVGTRIAAFRKLRGLTQQGLATQASISYSLLTKVESGHKPASPSLIARCARVLCVSVPDLEGRPYIADLQRDRLHELVDPIRAALENWDIELAWDVPARPIDAVRGDVQRLLMRRRVADYAAMARVLPTLVDDLVQLVHVAEDRDRGQVFDLLASAYRCVHTLAYKLGLVDLGTVALDRMGWAAVHAQDPYMPVLHAYLRGQQTFVSGRHEVGLRLVEAGQRGLESTPAGTSGTALMGSLHLQGAMLAARRGDYDQTRERLATAAEIANASGELPDYGLGFGPTNVVAHRIAASLDMDEPGDAIRFGEEFRPPAEWSPSRRGHVWIDLGRANLLAGRPETALACLNQAREAAPQQARYHSSVRETVAALARQKRATMGSLSNYASWIGI